MGEETTNTQNSGFTGWINNLKAKAASAALGFFGHSIDNTALQGSLKKTVDKTKPKRRIVYKSIDGTVFPTKGAAARYNGMKLRQMGQGKIILKNPEMPWGQAQWVQRTPNTSSTRKHSEELENNMYYQLQEFRKANNYRTKKSDIPYGTKTIRVKPKGSTLSYIIPVNALDTLAKYAGRERASMAIPLGLADQETKFGRQIFGNYTNNAYDNKALANSNYFKAFGSIPAENLVRDFRYNDDITAQKYIEPNYIDLSIHPIQHAIREFKSGKYNPGDSNHTKDVLNAGNNLMNETTGAFKNWWLTEGKAWYEGRKK